MSIKKRDVCVCSWRVWESFWYFQGVQTYLCEQRPTSGSRGVFLIVSTLVLHPCLSQNMLKRNLRPRPHSLLTISSASASDPIPSLFSEPPQSSEFTQNQKLGKLFVLAAVPCGGLWVESAFFSQPDVGRTGWSEMGRSRRDIRRPLWDETVWRCPHLDDRLTSSSRILLDVSMTSFLFRLIHYLLLSFIFHI